MIAPNILRVPLAAILLAAFAPGQNVLIVDASGSGSYRDIPPALAVANHVDQRSFVSMAQLAALDTIAERAPSRADYDEELHCLAKNIYFEARGEPDDGKRAVAHVVLNRVADKRFPDSVCRVVYQGGETVRHRCQFSWWCDGQSDRPRNLRKWQTIKAMAEAVYWGRSEDPTGGALWYHADYVSPYWGRVFKRSRQIGRHIFYHDQKKPARIASRATQTASAP